MNIISALTLNCLPFKEEPITQWNERTDLLAFLSGLLDLDFTVIDENGNERKGNYKDLAPGYFEEGQKSIHKRIDLFSESAVNSASSESSLKIMNKSDFESSIIFGRAAKYLSAWEQMISNTLSESVFFSLQLNL